MYLFLQTYSFYTHFCKALRSSAMYFWPNLKVRLYYSLPGSSTYRMSPSWRSLKGSNPEEIFGKKKKIPSSTSLTQRLKAPKMADLFEHYTQFLPHSHFGHKRFSEHERLIIMRVSRLQDGGLLSLGCGIQRRSLALTALQPFGAHCS